MSLVNECAVSLRKENDDEIEYKKQKKKWKMNFKIVTKLDECGNLPIFT